MWNQLDNESNRIRSSERAFFNIFTWLQNAKYGRARQAVGLFNYQSVSWKYKNNPYLILQYVFVSTTNGWSVQYHFFDKPTNLD